MESKLEKLKDLHDEYIRLNKELKTYKLSQTIIFVVLIPFISMIFNWAGIIFAAILYYSFIYNNTNYAKKLKDEIHEVNVEIFNLE